MSVPFHFPAELTRREKISILLDAVAGWKTRTARRSFRLIQNILEEKGPQRFQPSPFIGGAVSG